MGGGNNPQAVPAFTGAGHEGWARSEFGANSWPSFEGISAQLPREEWSMDSRAVSTAVPFPLRRRQNVAYT